jgi:hypothetical protein
MDCCLAGVMSPHVSIEMDAKQTVLETIRVTVLMKGYLLSHYLLYDMMRDYPL